MDIPLFAVHGYRHLGEEWHRFIQSHQSHANEFGLSSLTVCGSRHHDVTSARNLGITRVAHDLRMSNDSCSDHRRQKGKQYVPRRAQLRCRLGYQVFHGDHFIQPLGLYSTDGEAVVPQDQIIHAFKASNYPT
jgi:hypothetical protein